MIRAFETHKIRRCEELSSSLWDLSIPTASEAVHRLRVPVPGCWETYPQTRTYRGKAAYERSFEAGGNIRLVFKGVSHTADVFLDGKKIAHHYNAYTPFDVLVTGLEEGTHLLRVEADNSYGPSSTLHFPNDYQTYGGTRGAVMEAIGDLFIEKLHFTPFRKEDGWYGTICLSLRNVSPAAVSGTLSLAMNEMVFSTVPVTVDAGECRDLVPAFPGIHCNGNRGEDRSVQCQGQRAGNSRGREISQGETDRSIPAILLTERCEMKLFYKKSSDGFHHYSSGDPAISLIVIWKMKC